MNEFQTQAQALANEVLKALDIECLPLVPQQDYHWMRRWCEYALDFRYSDVNCRIIVTTYTTKPPEIDFCATGRLACYWHDEMNSADNAQDLLAGIPDTITRAKDVERQDKHANRESQLANGGTGQDLPAVGGNS